MALATNTQVKTRLGITASTWDALITAIIAEVQAKVESRCGRVFEQATYTDEYLSGDGTDILWLRHGPLGTVTSVAHITYGGTTSRTETSSTVQEAERLEGGLLSEGWKGRGFLKMNGGTWAKGHRNYKVTYQAGWATVPKDLEKAVIEWSAAAFLLRETTGLAAKSIGDATHDPLSPEDADAALDRALGPYILYTDLP